MEHPLIQKKQRREWLTFAVDLQLSRRSGAADVIKLTDMMSKTNGSGVRTAKFKVPMTLA